MKINKNKINPYHIIVKPGCYGVYVRFLAARVSGGYGIAILREVQMLLESRENDVVERIFKNRRVYVKKALG